MVFETQRLPMPAAAYGRAARRAKLFREPPLAKLERWLVGTVWALMPARITGLPALAKLCFDEILAPDYAVPDPERALANPRGLAGIVHDLSPPALMAAYRQGLFPDRK